MNEPSRAQLRHWGFVFKVLPGVLLGPEGRAELRSAPLDEVNRALLDLWRTMPHADPFAAPPTAGALDVSGDRGILIVMPPTSRSPEAYYVAWLRHEGRDQLFTWERAMEGFGGAVLGGVEPDQSHVNYGHRPGDHGRDAFFAAVMEVTGLSLRVTEEAKTAVPVIRLQTHQEPRTFATIARDVFLGLIVLLFVALVVATVIGTLR